MSRVALVVAACGHPAPSAQPPKNVQTPDAALDAPGKPLDEDLPRLADRALQMQKALLAALTAAGTDCAAAAAKINAVADANADVIAANAKILRAGHDRIKQLRETLAARDADFDAEAQAIAKAITASNCAGNAAFARAFDRISEGS